MVDGDSSQEESELQLGRPPLECPLQIPLNPQPSASPEGNYVTPTTVSMLELLDSEGGTYGGREGRAYGGHGGGQGGEPRQDDQGERRARHLTCHVRHPTSRR